MSAASPRLVQFRLRTLMIVMMVVAVCLGWWSHKARQQREAVAALRESNEKPVYDFEEQGLQRPAYWPGWLVDALGVDYFANVNYVAPDVLVVVFRHHPGLIDTKQRMEARERDEKLLLDAANNDCGGFQYGGGLGSGYELSIPARHLGRWKAAVDQLHDDGKLTYYDRWRLNDSGYGLVPVH